MSARCQTLVLLACLVLVAAEPIISTPERKSSLSGDDKKHLPVRPLARLGTRRLQQERGVVTAVAFSPDGKILAIHDELWDAFSGKILRPLQMPAADGLSYTPIHKLTFAPDGKVLAGQCRHCVRLWETATGKELRLLSCPEGTFFHALAFSPDGKHLATSLWDEKDKASPILLWETATGREVRRFAGHETPAHQLAFSADGKKLISLHLHSASAYAPPSSAPGSVVVWEVASGKQLLSRSEPCLGILSRDGKLYTRQGVEGRIQILDLDKHRLLRTLETEDAGHVFSPDGKSLACADKRNVIRLWDVASGRLLKQMTGRREEIQDGNTLYFPFDFSPDGKFLATGSHNDNNHPGSVYLWDVAKGEELLPADDHFAAVTCLAFAADGKTLASGSVDRTLHVWDTASGRHLQRFVGHKDRIDAVALSPNGQLLASSGRDKMLRIWDTRSGRQLHALDSPANAPHSLTFLADGKTLQWWGGMGKLHRYDSATGKRIETLRSRRGLFYVTPLGADGLTAPATFAAGENAAWPHDLLLPKLRQKIKDTSVEKLYGNPQHIRVSADGRMAATVETICLGGLAGALCRIRIWEMASGGLIADLGETNGSSCLLVFSRDRWGLFSAGEIFGALAQCPLQGWDLIAGKSVQRFQAPLSTFSCLAVSPDGTKLAAGHDDASVHIWDITGLFQPPAAPPLSSAELQRLGDRLLDSDAAAAYRAMYRLARSPEQSVPFLHERLRKLAPPMPQLRQLLADLDDEKFAVREQASKALERLGLSVESALRRARENPPSLEVRLRIDRLLGKLADEGQRQRIALQVLRGISILERIGTAKARVVLRELATTTPDSDVGLEAEAALHRLEQQPLRPHSAP